MSPDTQCLVCGAKPTVPGGAAFFTADCDLEAISSRSGLTGKWRVMQVMLCPDCMGSAIRRQMADALKDFP